MKELAQKLRLLSDELYQMRLFNQTLEDDKRKV